MKKQIQRFLTLLAVLLAGFAAYTVQAQTMSSTPSGLWRGDQDPLNYQVPFEWTGSVNGGYKFEVYRMENGVEKIYFTKFDTRKDGIIGVWGANWSPGVNSGTFQWRVCALELDNTYYPTGNVGGCATGSSFSVNAMPPPSAPSGLNCMDQGYDPTEDAAYLYFGWNCESDVQVEIYTNSSYSGTPIATFFSSGFYQLYDYKSHRFPATTYYWRARGVTSDYALNNDIPSAWSSWVNGPSFTTKEDYQQAQQVPMVDPINPTAVSSFYVYGGYHQVQLTWSTGSEPRCSYEAEFYNNGVLAGYVKNLRNGTGNWDNDEKGVLEGTYTWRMRAVNYDGDELVQAGSWVQGNTFTITDCPRDASNQYILVPVDPNSLKAEGRQQTLNNELINSALLSWVGSVCIGHQISLYMNGSLVGTQDASFSTTYEYMGGLGDQLNAGLYTWKIRPCRLNYSTGEVNSSDCGAWVDGPPFWIGTVLTQLSKPTCSSAEVLSNGNIKFTYNQPNTRGWIRIEVINDAGFKVGDMELTPSGTGNKTYTWTPDPALEAGKSYTSRIRAEATVDGPNDLGLMVGQTEITTWNGGCSFTVPSDGSHDPEPEIPTLDPPSNPVATVASNNQKVTFTWVEPTPKKQNQYYYIYISRKAEYTTLKTIGPVTGTSADWNLPDADEYKWQIQTVIRENQQNTLQSDRVSGNNFTVQSAAAGVVHPDNLTATVANNQNSVTFTWTPVSGQEYRVRILQGATTVTTLSKTSSGSSIWNPNGKGKYSCRIAVVSYNNGTTINQNDWIWVDGNDFTVLGKPENASATPAVNQTSVEFNWTFIAGHNYELEIYKAGQRVATGTSSTGTYKWTSGIAAGDYTWKIRAVTYKANNTVDGYTEWVNGSAFTILTKPAGLSRAVAADYKSVTFNWTSVANHLYEIRILKGGNVYKTIKNLSGGSTVWNGADVLQGDYTWEIRAYKNYTNGDLAQATAYTAGEGFTIYGLTTPTGLTTSTGMVGNMPYVNFNWGPAGQLYEFELYPKGGGNAVHTETAFNKVTWRWSQVVAGTYTWKVRAAIYDNNNSLIFATAWVNGPEVTVITPPKNVRAVVNSTTAVSFTWSGDASQQYQIEIKNASGTVVKTLQKQQNGRAAWEESQNITPGTYTWRIRAAVYTTGNNVGGSSAWVDGNAFEIKQQEVVLPPLTAPTNAVASASEQTVNFSWQGAADQHYDLTVYNAQQQAVKTFTNLAALTAQWTGAPAGSYTWEVSAVDKENDRSTVPVSGNGFTVLTRPSSLRVASKSETSVTFSWIGNSSQQYEIKISKAGSADVTLTWQSGGQAVWNTGVTPGDYTWQMRAVRYSGTSTLVVQSTGWVSGPAFTITEQVVEPQLTAPTQASASVNIQTVNLGWQGPADQKYNVEISDENGLAKEFTAISGNSAVWENAPAGNYTWEVYAVIYENNQMTYSTASVRGNAFTVIVLSEPAALNAVADVIESENVIAFAWQGKDGQSYELEVKCNGETVVSQTALQQTDFALMNNVKAGHYTWKVRTVLYNAQNEVERATEWVNGNEFAIRYKKPVQPRTGDIYVGSRTENGSVPFIWQAPENSLFQIMVYDAQQHPVIDNNQGLLIPGRGTQAYTWSVSGLVENAEYTWKIRAVDYENKGTIFQPNYVVDEQTASPWVENLKFTYAEKEDANTYRLAFSSECQTEFYDIESLELLVDFFVNEEQKPLGDFNYEIEFTRNRTSSTGGGAIEITVYKDTVNTQMFRSNAEMQGLNWPEGSYKAKITLLNARGRKVTVNGQDVVAFIQFRIQSNVSEKEYETRFISASHNGVIETLGTGQIATEFDKGEEVAFDLLVAPGIDNQHMIIYEISEWVNGNDANTRTGYIFNASECNDDEGVCRIELKPEKQFISKDAVYHIVIKMSKWSGEVYTYEDPSEPEYFGKPVSIDFLFATGANAKPQLRITKPVVALNLELETLTPAFELELVNAQLGENEGEGSIHVSIVYLTKPDSVIFSDVIYSTKFTVPEEAGLKNKHNYIIEFTLYKHYAGQKEQPWMISETQGVFARCEFRIDLGEVAPDERLTLSSRTRIDSVWFVLKGTVAGVMYTVYAENTDPAAENGLLADSTEYVAGEDGTTEILYTEVPEGTYAWKARSRDGKWFNGKNFTVTYPVEPEKLAAPTGLKVEVKEGVAYLSWEVEEGCFYNVTIYQAGEAGAEQVVMHGTDYGDGAMQIGTLKEGTYGWGVVAFRGSDYSAEARGEEFSIEAAANESLDLPGVNVYPNPSSGKVNVYVPVEARVDIFNAHGRVVCSAQSAAGVYTCQLPVSGVYFVRVSSGNRAAVKRVIVR